MYKFQSLSGFQVRCNSLAARGLELKSGCFNPYRVYKFAATSTPGLGTADLKCFNPYRVFKFAATVNPNRCPISWRLCFNPYRVFKFAATIFGPHVWLGYVEFQSLSGFQVRCNPEAIAASCGLLQEVSIPIGFSSSLQHCKLTRLFLVYGKFQSLSGFQVRCNFRAV